MKCSVSIYIIALLFLFAGCDQNKEPVKIGFIGTLTGPFASIGISGRDAVLLAFEEINGQGGVNGQELELVVKDDEGSSETALVLSDELIAEGVLAIIGPTLSNVGLELAPYLSEKKMLLISSTVSTNKLNDIDDYHIKFIAVKNRNKIIADLLLSFENSDNAVFVYDINNEGFALNYINSYTPYFLERGGKVLEPVVYNPKEDISYTSIAMDIISRNSKSVIFLGDNRNTALICQQLNKQNYAGYLFSNAMTSQLIEHGGAAVDGFLLISTFDPSDESPAFTAFKENYYKRFAAEVNFSSKRNYEAAYALYESLKVRKEGENLKETILSLKVIQGLQGQLEINKYGDVSRPMFRFIVKDGKFVKYE